MFSVSQKKTLVLNIFPVSLMLKIPYNEAKVDIFLYQSMIGEGRKSIKKTDV
jgi:hypothetical protein